MFIFYSLHLLALFKENVKYPIFLKNKSKPLFKFKLVGFSLILYVFMVNKSFLKGFISSELLETIKDKKVES